ncbi:MAG TPA: nuclear transport factor 2 family protein [Pirellulales bacterium]|nr:nuclear transport factor 2 family protein [Pirellulales bacterium]
MYFYRHRLGGALAAGLVVCLACGRGWADEAARGSDEAAIRQRTKDYLDAIRRGDAKEIASFWTAEGDYVDETGQAVNGRHLAQRAATKTDDENEPRRLAHTGSLRFITPDVVIEDATITVDPAPLGPALSRRFTAIWTRRDGKWLLDGVRELAAPVISHHDHLGALSWMLGEWASDDGGKTLHLVCKWSDDEQFLIREIDVELPERGRLHVTQRIGWDAHEKQIKSWSFDSQGGHALGLWFGKPDRWIIEAESVSPDGSRSTGTNIYSPDGPDAFVWEATNVEINGEPTPDRSLRMVRQKESK